MITIDAMGKQCPVPLIMTKNEIAKSGKGEYAVLVDNDIAVQNLEKMAKQYNFEFSYKKIDNNNFEVNLNVGSDPGTDLGTDTGSDPGFHPGSDPGSVPRSVPGSDPKNTVVVYKSEFMGHGDEDLGKVLVKGSIYAFSQLENPPKTFIFYNSGVKLACADSDNVEDLNTLKDKGVKIFACGTCLNHYGLQDKLAVGEVTNMYDIVEMLNNAVKIIIP